MDIQVHARTRQIKKLSLKLFKILTLFRYLLYMGWPAIIFVAIFLDEGTLKIGESELLIEQVGQWMKFLVLTLFAFGLYLAIRITNNFRQLMSHFMQGDVFSKEAINNVRAGLLSGVMFFMLAIVHHLFGWGVAMANDSPIHISLGMDFLISLIFFGLMYTLLWALEIGRDLNEESEMTV